MLHGLFVVSVLFLVCGCGCSYLTYIPAVFACAQLAGRKTPKSLTCLFTVSVFHKFQWVNADDESRPALYPFQLPNVSWMKEKKDKDCVFHTRTMAGVSLFYSNVFSKVQFKTALL